MQCGAERAGVPGPAAHGAGEGEDRDDEKDYLSRVLQETSNEMVDALLAATQADLINAFCRMLSISGCFLLFAVRRPRGAAASKKEKVA